MRRKDTVKISVKESTLLVPVAKSKRLAALQRQSGREEDGPEGIQMEAADSFSGLGKEASAALTEARVCIDRQIEQIKKRYPPGRQIKLFTIRFGALEQIKRKSIKEIFALLGLDAKRKNFSLIEHLDYDGNETDAGRTEKAWKKRN